METIKCAAIRTKEGKIFRGSSHGICISNAIMADYSLNPRTEGFMTSNGRFVTRHQALNIQKHARISSRSKDGYNQNFGLTSDDLILKEHE